MNQNAKWIKSPIDTGAASVTFRRKLALRGEALSAKLCVTAVGVYKAELNGERVGTDVLAPGITGYRHRVQYETHDVTALMKKNITLDISVGAGWAVGFYGYKGKDKSYADQVAALASLHIVYTDGTEEDTTFSLTPQAQRKSSQKETPKEDFALCGARGGFRSLHCASF